MDDHKGGWNSWIKKPSKIFGTSPSQSQTSLHQKPSSQITSGFIVRSPSNASAASTLSPTTTRTARGKRESVTEIVEPVVVDSDSEDSDDEDDTRDSARRSRVSFGADSVNGNGERSDYSWMERSESNKLEDEETVRKFRAVFALSENEELIDRESLAVLLRSVLM
jgi:sterol 3beta-glucosyltransferase